MTVVEANVRIEVGLAAYETFNCVKYDRKKLTSVDRHPYRFAVCVVHVPSGRKVYIDEYCGQYKNYKKAMRILSDETAYFAWLEEQAWKELLGEEQ